MVPEGPQGRHSFFGGSTLAVYKTTKHMDEAVELIKFLSSKEAQVEYSKRHGNLPATKEAYDDPYIAEDQCYQYLKNKLNMVDHILLFLDGLHLKVYYKRLK